MSAPDTDPKKQFSRHPVSLIAMGVLCALVLIGFIWWLSYEVDTPTPSPYVQEQQDGLGPEAIEPPRE